MSDVRPSLLLLSLSLSSSSLRPEVKTLEQDQSLCEYANRLNALAHVIEWH